MPQNEKMDAFGYFWILFKSIQPSTHSETGYSGYFPLYRYLEKIIKETKKRCFPYSRQKSIQSIQSIAGDIVLKTISRYRNSIKNRHVWRLLSKYPEVSSKVSRIYNDLSLGFNLTPNPEQ